MVIPNLFPRSDARTSEAKAGFAHTTFLDAGQTSVVAGEQAQLESEPPQPPDPLSIQVTVPGLGRRSVRAQRRLLGALLVGTLTVLLPAAIYKLNLLDTLSRQIKATGQVMLQSQRLAKSVSQALVGNPAAFTDLAESAEILSKSFDGLENGDGAAGLRPLPADVLPLLLQAKPLVEQAKDSANTILTQQKVLEQIAAALQRINRQSEDLLELTRTISSMKQQQGASPGDISAVGELSTLTQRIGKSANEFLTSQGVSPEAVFLLGKDLNSFRDIAQGLLDGSADLRLTATKDKPTRERLAELITMFNDSRVQAGAILDNLQLLIAVRQAQSGVIAGSESLGQKLEALQSQLSNQTQDGVLATGALAPLALIAALCASGLWLVQVRESRARQELSESQRQLAQDRRVLAERLEADARRVNDANQSAILRLMNELQAVSEGDLTQEATVSEDITGAIADSVNYTVEELRTLVSNVQSTADRVAQTSAAVDSTATLQLVASNAQLLEIREAGRSVVEMSVRINDVSIQAQESALVARQSLQAAESGLHAVQNAIGGMNIIRDQIQETSKRIKRLGESSQEIGEITELISDITEQTNVLALNAAIQAASAGEAGRGFSVVAEEVQRLAERSADATRKIAALVKVIQTDTQNAIAAMELSAQGVVAGARLSDNAGAALSEIDQVSRRVADRIEQISAATSREAGLANLVADGIQHISAVTEQTVEGTRATANGVRELSLSAQQLRQSVSRFKIA